MDNNLKWMYDNLASKLKFNYPNPCFRYFYSGSDYRFPHIEQSSCHAFGTLLDPRYDCIRRKEQAGMGGTG